MWNIITVIFCAMALLFNSYLWYKHRQKATKEEMKKQGWNAFHMISTLLIVVVLLQRIGKF
ncbi:hypothetical protein [Marivirga sp.]|uniref:hypothetical protein n=1 Tax=Marivirga sp. TaxID=2018662 RepID=UPI002D7E697D|nr:hypothetical protein [Marivirga sp.]HET8858887.1 hypothetical protein [Marivirga sp.]